MQTLQEGFLPTHLPRTARLRVDAVYQAAEADALVGGDWFDAVELPDGRTLISVGDVTGHGLGASSLAARLRHAILDFALDEPDPANVLASANRVLQLERPGTFATALVAFVDAAGETLAYATAGHPPPLLARTSHEPAEELRAGGITLGVESAFETTTIRVALSPGAVAAFYTDGVVEFAREPAIAEARRGDDGRRRTPHRALPRRSRLRRLRRRYTAVGVRRARRLRRTRLSARHHGAPP